MAFKVEQGACEGDARCVDACPVGAIAMVDERAVIDEAECIACGCCVVECPVRAIVDA